MKVCSISALRSNPYRVVRKMMVTGEEVLLTSKGKFIAKIVPIDDEVEDEGALKPSFVAEVKRRMKEDKLIPAEEVFKRLW